MFRVGQSARRVAGAWYIAFVVKWDILRKKGPERSIIGSGTF